jgi:hypothetical protein
MNLRMPIISASAVLVFASGIAAAAFEQVALPFNADVVREPGGAITGGGVDPAGRGFVTQSEAAAGDAATPHGLPDNGVLQVQGGTIQLGPYNGNNALRFGDFGTNSTGVFIPIEPGTYDSIQIYGAGETANPAGAPQLSVRFQTLPGFFTGVPLDWKKQNTPLFGTSSFPLTGLDTTGAGGTGLDNVDNAGIACWSFTIPRTGIDPISGVTIMSIISQGQFNPTAVSVLAVTLTPVPEPASLGLAAVAGAALLLRHRR